MSVGPGDPALHPVGFPLMPGETIVRQYAMDLTGMVRLRRRRFYFLIGIMLIVLLPFFFLTAFSGGSRGLGIAAFAFGVPLVLILGVFGAAMLRAGPVQPSYATVTTRRVLVENLGRGESSASMPLDNVQDVQIETASQGKSLGIVWVYLLPLGATAAMVGSGRYRRAAPGVVWIPALQRTQAEELKQLVMTQAQTIQAREAAAPPPG